MEMKVRKSERKFGGIVKFFDFEESLGAFELFLGFEDDFFAEFLDNVGVKINRMATADVKVFIAIDGNVGYRFLDRVLDGQVFGESD